MNGMASRPAMWQLIVEINGLGLVTTDSLENTAAWFARMVARYTFGNAADFVTVKSWRVVTP